MLRHLMMMIGSYCRGIWHEDQHKEIEVITICKSKTTEIQIKVSGHLLEQVKEFQVFG